MASLPVLRTVGAAYRFLVRDFTTLVRLAWFPLLVLAVVQYLAAEATLDAVAGGPGGEDQPVATPYDLVQWVVQIVVFAIVAVSLHRVILFGDRRPGQYIAFAFGRPEILFAVLQVLAFVGYFVVGLAAAIALAGHGLTLTAPPPLASLLAFVVIAVALTFSLVRFAPLYPIAAAEKRLDFRQARQLTDVKFWRLLPVVGLGGLPLGALSVL